MCSPDKNFEKDITIPKDLFRFTDENMLGIDYYLVKKALSRL